MEKTYKYYYNLSDNNQRNIIYHMLPMTLSLGAFLYLLNYKLKLARFTMTLTLRQLAPRSDVTSLRIVHPQRKLMNNILYFIMIVFKKDKFLN